MNLEVSSRFAVAPPPLFSQLPPLYAPPANGGGPNPVPDASVSVLVLGLLRFWACDGSGYRELVLAEDAASDGVEGCGGGDSDPEAEAVVFELAAEGLRVCVCLCGCGSSAVVEVGVFFVRIVSTWDIMIDFVNGNSCLMVW